MTDAPSGGSGDTQPFSIQITVSAGIRANAAPPQPCPITQDTVGTLSPVSICNVLAISPAWVRVSKADGSILFEKILDGGESFVLPAGVEATNLRAGNSGSVFVSVGGVIYGPVGKDTSVVRNVALEAGQITATFAEVSEAETLKAMASPRVITLNASNK